MVSDNNIPINIIKQGYLLQFILNSPENISANFGDGLPHCKNLQFENVGESQLKMMSLRIV